MTLSLAILADAAASLALLSGLGYVMSRATLLTPHLATDVAAPKVARSTPNRSRDHRHGAAARASVAV